MTTPYGYGGPLVLECEFGHGARVMADFRREIVAFCASEQIVSEFVRFHPLLGNARDVAPREMTIQFGGETVYVDLTGDDTSLFESMHPSSRNKVRKSRRCGVDVAVGGEEYLDDLVQLYTETMRRLGARHSYRFGYHYFQSFFHYLPEQTSIAIARYQQRSIMAALVLGREQIVHYHLSGSDPAFRHLGANNLLLFELARWARTKGARYLHLGGGYVPGDSLFSFKASLSPLRGSYCTGRRIYSEEVYNRLVENRRIDPAFDSNTSFFPAYRFGLE
jgi:hypothetical protein